jgi:hypothetical protein
MGASAEKSMKSIHIAVENELSQLTNQLIDKKFLPLTIMLFHEDGYRKIASRDMSAMTLAKAYLNQTDAHAYAVMFDGSYEDPIDGAKDCLICAVVTEEGNARVEHTPYSRNGGLIEFHDKRLALIEAPYLHLFNQFDPSKYNMAMIKELLEEIYEAPVTEYSDFIVATC